MLEKLKQHPWIVGGAVGLLLLILVFSSSSGSSTTATDATTGSSSTSGNGDQVAEYMAALNQQGTIAGIAAGVQNEQTAGAVTVAQLQAGTADNANTLAAQVAEYETKIAGDVSMNHDTLTASVENNQINAGVTNTSTVANALVQQQQISADVNKAYINTIGAVQTQQIQSNENVQTQSLWSKLFG